MAQLLADQGHSEAMYPILLCLAGTLHGVRGGRVVPLHWKEPPSWLNYCRLKDHDPRRTQCRIGSALSSASNSISEQWRPRTWGRSSRRQLYFYVSPARKLSASITRSTWPNRKRMPMTWLWEGLRTTDIQSATKRLSATCFEHDNRQKVRAFNCFFEIFN